MARVEQRTARSSVQMRSLFLARLLSYAGDAGRTIAARHGLAESAVADVAISLSTLDAICEEVERALGDPFVGLHAAISSPRGTYGVMELSARSAATLGEAFARVVRYQRLVNDVATFTLEREAETASIEHRIPGQPEASGRHANEFTAAILVLMSRELTGSRILPRIVSLAHPAPANRGPLIEYLGTDRLVFAAGANRVTWDAAVFDTTLVSADPVLLPILDRHAEMLAPLAPAGVDLLDRTRDQIRLGLSSRSHELGHVAHALHVSRRTLQRRIEERGTSFQELVDGVRRDLSVRYVVERTLSIAEITFLLGYSDARAFLRAFKRWFGCTPGQYVASRAR
jgi:AraC-like DNA-binding protein